MMMFCTTGALADQLQAQAESETNALQPQHQYVPWVRALSNIIDDIHAFVVHSHNLCGRSEDVQDKLDLHA